MFLTKPEYVKANPSRVDVGFQFLLNVIDIFSRKAWTIVLNDRSTEQVTNAFRKLRKIIGVGPVRLLTDGGGEFNSSEFRDMLKEDENLGKSVQILGNKITITVDGPDFYYQLKTDAFYNSFAKEHSDLRLSVYMRAINEENNI